MRRSSIAVLVTIVVAGLCRGAELRLRVAGGTERRDPLDAYTATVSPEELADLAAQGYDVGEQQRSRAAR